MFIALRDLAFAKGRFLLMATVVELVAFLMTLLSGLATGLIRNNISGLMALDVSHIAFEYNKKPNYRNSMIDREMWEGWREIPASSIRSRSAIRCLWPEPKPICRSTTSCSGALTRALFSSLQ